MLSHNVLLQLSSNSRSNRSKTSASFSSGVPNTEKKMKARRRRWSAFIVSRFLEPLMKNELLSWLLKRNHRKLCRDMFCRMKPQAYQTVFVRSQHAPYKYSNFLANRYCKYLRTFALIVYAHPYCARNSCRNATPRHASSARAEETFQPHIG